MNYPKHVNQALGQAARNSVKSQTPRKESDRRIAEKTFSVMGQTIAQNDRWTQAEVRDVLSFRDAGGAIWWLSIFNRHARLYLVLIRDASGTDIGWRGKELLVGWPIEKENGRFGFALACEFADFMQWRRGIMRDRPVSRSVGSSS